MSGIVAVDACRLQGCSVYNNGQSGITANRGCSVLECVAVSNTYGIAVKDNCLVVRNTCSGNARTNSIYAAGILVDGSANRIEGNHVEGNVYGIRIFDSPGTTNLVIRNTALRNSTANYSLQTGTVYGPILSMNNSGVLTNTSPWINFELAP
jgi:parallel beta-helix repeat protein